jgi:hypothetical protein
MTGLPLVNSLTQARGPGTKRRVESYYVPGLNPFSPTALDALPNLEPPLPQQGDPHPQDPTIFVTDIAVLPWGGRTDASRVNYTYSSIQFGGEPYSEVGQLTGDLSFEIVPETVEIKVPVAYGVPLKTVTAETDSNGNPTGNDIGTTAIGFERGERLLRDDRARVTYTVSGTAAELGLPTTGITIGNVNRIVSRQREIHVIDGLALLFKVGSVRQTRRGASPDANQYTIAYEWVYETGVRWVSLPEGWANSSVMVGPAGGMLPLFNTTGNFPVDNVGDAISGVALPDLPAPASIAPFFGTGRTYIVPPFCDCEMLMDTTGDFPVPKFTVTPRYNYVNRDAWRTLPGMP